MTHLYLIRHGQAMGAVQHMIGNTKLSPFGVRQAERLRDRLAATSEIKADVLIASTLLRAKETAEIVAPALGLPIIFDDEVQEWREGKVENLTVEEYNARFRIVELEQKPFLHMASNSENWVQFVLRVSTALNRITQEYAGKTIVIVCHGGIIDCSFIFFLGLSSLHFPRAFFDTHNTSITHWFRDSFADLPASWILGRYNDTMHLCDLASPVRIPWKELTSLPLGSTDPATVPTEAQ